MTRSVEHRPATDGRPPLRIERSTRRRRTASAFVREGTLVVQLPAGLAAAEEDRMVAGLVAKVVRRRHADDLGGDAALHARALALAAAHLDGVAFTSIRFSGRMQRRWGSCTPATGELRISRDVAVFPAYARDFVILHELAHLLEPNHSPAFHALLDRHPQAERARGFLEGVALGRGWLDGGLEDDVG